MQSNAFRLVVLTTIAFIANTAIVARSQSSSWTPNGSMPFERGEIAVAAVTRQDLRHFRQLRGVGGKTPSTRIRPASGMWPGTGAHALRSRRMLAPRC